METILQAASYSLHKNEGFYEITDDNGSLLQFTGLYAPLHRFSASGGDDVEIIIVDDGSTDSTGKIADEYAAAYPATVRVIHQKNGGHGEGLNTGILHATGLYFKVVDSDDWVDPESYREILHTLRSLCSGGCMLDLMISNFVYEKDGSKHKKVMRYNRILPRNQLFDWTETKNFKIGKYILMHSVIYRTQLLRDCRLVLPKHTFYVDNLFVYVPLPYVKTMYYLDVTFTTIISAGKTSPSMNIS